MSEFPRSGRGKPRLPVGTGGYLLHMDRENEPYEGEEAKSEGGDFSNVDPDELTGPGGRLPAVDGLTDADDPKETTD